MGDMADYLLDEDASDAAWFFEQGPKWLVEHTASARKPIVVSIRRQWNTQQWMSQKQQWVLAFYAAEQDHPCS